jgi:DHA1 family multidrug resistance protein-like MFS transporter
VLVISALVASVFYALQATVNHTTQLILLQICVGVAMSGTLSSLTALLATLAPEGQQGAVYGMDTSVSAGANAVGPMLGASIAVVLGNRAPFLVAAAVFILAAALVWGFLSDRRPAIDASVECVPSQRRPPIRSAKTQ